LQIDWANYLPEYILRKGDLCTMAHGLELRAPLLDPHICPDIAGPAEDTRFTKPQKRILAAALEPLSDLELFTRKKRRLQSATEALVAWCLVCPVRGLWEGRLDSVTNGLLSAAAVTKMIDAYSRARSRSPKESCSFSFWMSR
jgi:asparagine synthase (glutamine-hydrolysing)